MKYLFYVEFKRMAKSRVFHLVFIIGIGLSILIPLYLLPGNSIDVPQPSGETLHLKGLEAVSKINEIEKVIQGEITEESIEKVITDLRKAYDNYKSYEDMPEEVLWNYITPYENIQMILTYAIPDIGKKSASQWDIDQNIIGNFHENYFSFMRDAIADEFKDSPKIIEKVNEKLDQVQNEGFHFHTLTGWGSAISYIVILLLFLSVLVSILTSSAFSTDYQSGMGEVFTTTLYGKNKLAIAKFFVNILYGSVLYIITTGIFIVGNIAFFGAESLKMSMQLIYPYLIVPGTLGEYILLAFIIGFISIIAQICFVFMVSSLSRSTTVSVIIGISFSIIPFFANMMIEKSNKLLYMLTDVLPNSGSHSFYELLAQKYFELGDILIWYPYLTIISAVAYILILPIIAIRSYCKHHYY